MILTVEVMTSLRLIIVRHVMNYKRGGGGMLASHLNNLVKDYSYREIEETLQSLLDDGTLAVTSKRWWVRSKPKAMDIINQSTLKHVGKAS